MANKNEKSKNVHLKADGSEERSVEKNTTVFDFGVIALNIAAFIAIMILSQHEMFALTVLIAMIPAAFSVGRIMDQATYRLRLKHRLESFAEVQMGLVESKASRHQSLINAVMNCSHGNQLSDDESNELRDERGNCLECKADFTAIATDGFTQYVHTQLDKAVQTVEKEEKERLKKEKEQQLAQQQKDFKLSSAQQQALVKAFDSPEKLHTMKRSAHSLEALREISNEDIMATLTTDGGESNELSASLQELTATDSWDKEFQS